MKEAKYLFPSDYMADPSANVFNGKLYIYPSHDWESGVPENDNGDHFNMKDYHCFTLADPETDICHDEGLILSVEDIPWAGRQLWDNDVVEKDGKYYLIFCLKDQNDIFRLGVAIADRPKDRSSRSPILSAGLIPSTPAPSRMTTAASMCISEVFGADSCRDTKTTRLSKVLICRRAKNCRFLRAWRR